MKVLVVVLASSLAGCATSEPPTSLTDQCRSLRDTIATYERPLRASISEGDRTLRKTAAAHEDAGAAVGALVLKDETLRGLQKRYADNARDFASARRDKADAIEAGDATGVTRTNARLSSTSAAETNLKKKIDAHCP